MRLFLASLVPLGIVALVAFAACGGSVDTGTGGATSSSSTSATTSASVTTGSTSTGAGGSAHGDCQSDADCNGKPCQPLTPGGYEVCINPIAEATSCNMMGPPNECCTSADCSMMGAGCYADAQLTFCGGAFPSNNECVSDQCTSDADCPQHTLCAPAGAFGFPKRVCLTAFCHTDADCSAKPGGACVPVGYDPCCALHTPSGLGCAYPGACQKDSDCPNNGQCTLDQTKGVTVCGPPSQGCPP